MSEPHDVAQGDHRSPEHQEATADVEQLLLDDALVGHVFGEDVLLQLFQDVLGPVGGVEVAVDDLVEQDVQQEAGAQLGRVGAVEPGPGLLDGPSDRLVVVLADADEPGRAHEEVHLLEVGGVGDDEAVGRVVLELGPLQALVHVLHGQGVEVQLGLDALQVGLVGRGDVRPDEAAGLGHGGAQVRGVDLLHVAAAVHPHGDHRIRTPPTSARTCSWRASTGPLSVS
jgi:hypothetical protein